VQSAPTARSLATSNPYKISQEGEKGFRAIAINAVTRAAKTLQPDQIRCDCRRDILHISEWCDRIIFACNDQSGAFDLISGHLGGCFVTTSFEKPASEPIGRTMTI
jgi:hypothetical protein